MSKSTGALFSNKELLKRRRKDYNFNDSNSTIDHVNSTFTKADKVATDNRKDWCISTLLTMWTCYIRFWKLSQPSSVVFDEVHFGGFATKYINKTFFIDVHPPLAKMMIAWAAMVAGFDGKFEFKRIGRQDSDYLDPKVPYVQIRAFCAFYGILVVPISYWSMRACDLSIPTAFLTAILLCYENGLVMNNRLILLDSILLYFTAFTLLMWFNFRKHKNRAFSVWWWIWLTLTGVGLGGTVSCKWVGLLTIATVGLAVVYELWNMWGDEMVSKCKFFKHVFARAVCLIVIPLVIYIGLFKVHFDMLPLSGSGDAAVSSEFQTSLTGHKFPKSSQADVVYGSRITLNHLAYRGGYLHSHEHQYPHGSKQQQVTVYAHVDEQNIWIIEEAHRTNFTVPKFVKNGDIVRLVHAKTYRRLHTHDIRPSTNDKKYQHEVSAYGYKGFEGDANDNWRVEIINNGSNIAVGDRIRARRSEFRLISTTQKCALFSRKLKLPDWAYGQQEVTCMKDALYTRSLWRVEMSTSDLLPEDTEMIEYESKGFLAKVWELHKVMWKVNAGLPANHKFASRPKDWPFLRRGVSFWTKDNRKIYLLGNPVVFWSSTTCVIIYIALKCIICILEKRQIRTDYFSGNWPKYDAAAGLLFVSWGMHFFPFNLFGRQLFLHHYMPALYMATLLVGVFYEMLTYKMSAKIRWTLVVVATIVVIYVYRIFLPITYGEPWSTKKCLEATWRPTWDMGCPWYDLKPRKTVTGRLKPAYVPSIEH
ncbi:glycosyltransferase family 39 protein [Parasitella parasitica]|nr:glycosyltransferase family 39 protein [Parasitella parasitica]